MKYKWKCFLRCLINFFVLWNEEKAFSCLTLLRVLDAVRPGLRGDYALPALCFKLLLGSFSSLLRDSQVPLLSSHILLLFLSLPGAVWEVRGIVIGSVSEFCSNTIYDHFHLSPSMAHSWQSPKIKPSQWNDTRLNIFVMDAFLKAQYFSKQTVGKIFSFWLWTKIC